MGIRMSVVSCVDRDEVPSAALTIIYLGSVSSILRGHVAVKKEGRYPQVSSSPEIADIPSNR
jgi:hypothetical protein